MESAPLAGGVGLDMSALSIPAVFGSILMDGDEYVRCRHCGYGGCDLRIQCDNGCTCHARCVQLSPTGGPLQACPMCAKPTQGIVMFPMSFREIDETRRTAAALASSKLGRPKKRKGGAGSDPAAVPSSGSAAGGGDTGAGTAPDDLGGFSDRRTGRWTTEEMAFCDKLMQFFAEGLIPVANGIKLNEFLGNMLRSKQSRLTKKMKNAKLSSKVYQRGRGYLLADEAREFSLLEEGFFHSVSDQHERAEIKFHMQREWREQFTQVCASLGQPVDAERWLVSVEEMDRRASQAKDAARMAKRKLMMGVALKADSQNTEQGVFIEKTAAEERAIASGGGGYSAASVGGGDGVDEDLLSMLVEEAAQAYSPLDLNGKSSLLHSAPFLAKITAYLQRHSVPFEHVDVWVPSYVGEGGELSVCRLCYAGCATADKVLEFDGKTARSLNPDESFNFHAFGDYSQKFSFDVGCGLPGRVYESGRPTWEQSVHNAPHSHFERCGGARQWNIRTVLGIPVASPNVGRIVVTFYSCLDRTKDEDLVSRLSDECTKLMPAPKWKLVVDIGEAEETIPAAAASSSANSVVANDQLHSTELPLSHQIQSSITRDLTDFSLLASDSAPVTNTAAQVLHDTSARNDPRVDTIVALLGEFMPTDPTSTVATYLNGFMSLRLLLLRPTRSLEEDELIRTILDSYSSYSAGGRARADIAVMLARDYIFLSQQQAPFLPFGQGMTANSQNSSSGLSVFGLPSTSSSLQNSPALTPIPAPGSIDDLSIVSN